MNAVFELCPFDVCQREFMQRALVAAFLIGLAAPAIGVFLVQRRLSLMGDGIGHVAFAGIAAGFLFGIAPVSTALLAAVIGAVALEFLRSRGRMAGDVALALIFYGGIAGAVFMTSLSNLSNANLIGYLFGSVVTVDTMDVTLSAAIAIAVLGTTFLLRKELFAVCYDEDVARTSGLNARALNLLIAVIAAVTVAVTMRVVGILLVSAMLVLPVAAALQLTRSFRATVLVSLALGAIESVGGLTVAYYGDYPPGATIVLGAIAVFGIPATFRMVTSRG
ncbi:MAG: iron chelate uptake ABC transporter family permease subunit [Actinobacteria bacterium]|nr:iron chelate uptake ABC transporter family permease subunit [Actinomycetota bacterium]